MGALWLTAVLLGGQSPPVNVPAPWRLEHVAIVGDNSNLFATVTGVAFGAPGQLLVLDGQTAEVVIVDLGSGAASRRVGAKGQGPGEFVEPRLIAATRGGTFSVFDRRGGNRISRFANDGTFLGSADLSRTFTRGVIRDMAVTDQGALLLHVPSAVEFSGRTRGRHPRLVFVAGRGGAERVIHEWTELEMDAMRPQDPRSSLKMYVDPRPLWSLLSNGNSAIGRSDRYELAVIDRNGDEVGNLRRNVEPVRITPEFKERFNEQLPVHMRDRGVEWGKFLPLIAGVFPGPDNTSLVMRGRNGAPVIDVFSSDHAFLAAIDLPRGFQLLAARGGLLAGRVQTDDLEDAVSILRLQR